MTARLIGETLRAGETPDLDEADRWLTTAMHIDRSNGLKLDLAHDYAWLADLHRANGNQSQTLSNLTRARDLFLECGATGFVDEIEQLIDQDTHS